MAPRRLFLPGLSHHVYHRGNNRTAIFRDDGDRTVFLALFGRAMRRSGVQVHSYALMDTHYHALVSAPDEEALPRTMQRLGRGYVRYFNERYGRTGTLWEGRYRASLVADERYWLTCMRYIERNPVEAGMVQTPGAYQWSSYLHHASGRPDPLLAPHILYDSLGTTADGRRAHWRALCGEALSPDDEALIRNALRSNAPLHRPGFCDPTESVSVAPFVPPT